MSKQDEEEINLINMCNPNLFKGIGRVGLVRCKCGRLKEWFNNQWHCECEDKKTEGELR